MQTQTVLFVDDEVRVLNSLKRLVRSEPYESLFAESGQEALNVLERKSVHVIVTDLLMPEMDGMALLEQVEQKYPHIISQSRSKESLSLRCLRSGFLTKELREF